MDTGIVTKGSRKSKKKTERDIELEMGDDYILDLNKKFDLPDEEKYDIIPEIWNGHNVADYVDPDIMQKLEQLEKEEELRERSGVYDSDMESDDETMKEIRELAVKIRTKKKLMKNEQRITRTKKPILPRTSEPKNRDRSVSRLKREFSELGVDMSGTYDANFAQTGSRSRSKVRKRERSASRGPARDESGVRDPEMRKKIRKMEKKVQKKTFNKSGKSGESDRHIAVKKPKHLFAGKRKMGKTDRR